MTLFYNPDPSIHNEVLEKHILPQEIIEKLKQYFGDDISSVDFRKETVEGNEDVFDLFDHDISHELIAHNVTLFIRDKKNLQEGLEAMLSIVEKRKNTWEINSNEQFAEEAERAIKELSNAKFQTDLFLGRGNAGHVFVAPNTKNYCIKYLHTPDRQATSLEEEFMLLGQVNQIAKNFKILRIPQAHCFAKNLNETKNFFTMQLITGLTLEQLVEFPSKREAEFENISIESMIALLEDKTMRQSLLEDLNYLHQNGVIHGDIHPRNIMLDKDGMITLIDFGNAVVPVNVSVHATYDSIENVKDLDIKTFFNSLDKTITLLKAQLLTK